ncbi:gpr fun34 family protein [Grosmannia clavigera kw1407]|uniref:Gpr fun34 family protein n=1 Tax=Grosmannia clavigera (strain kw1407 / UAMH 11150) TaxID=655863 RepID=F0XJX3_GROCL|nr:gpr fun34 family protein [Grosmannia clavigera kw1407]EFX01874.1 gpr fun34 family protein [Grosmannia clavigera kw1407]
MATETHHAPTVEKDTASTTGTAPGGAHTVHRFDYVANPLYHPATAADGRLPAFGGEFQPGLYKPVAHRKFANPAPLGLCAFAMTTFVLSLINLQTRGVTATNIVAPLALGYGGLVQLLAGMWEMAVGNTFGATALSSYGGFWISYAILLKPSWGILGSDGAYAAANTGGDPLMADSALGFYLIGWFIFTTIMLLCTLRSTVMFCALFFTLDLAFLMLACGNFAADNGAASASVHLTKAGGVFGLLSAFLAWYNAFAGIIDSSNSFFVIPVFHFPWSEKGYEARRKAANESV